MPTSKADLLFHPVRLRVIVALARGRRMTAQQLAEALGNVPQPTLYRHLNKLLKGGFLTVVEERPVRGTVERVYALPAVSMVTLSAQDAAAATPDDWMRYFTTFVAGLLGDFGRYLERDTIDLRADGVGFRQVVMYLSDEEFAQFTATLNPAFLAALARPPAPGRKRRVFTTVVMPVDDPPGAPPPPPPSPSPTT